MPMLRRGYGAVRNLRCKSGARSTVVSSGLLRTTSVYLGVDTYIYICMCVWGFRV